MKRISGLLSLLLVAAMMMTLITGCGEKTENAVSSDEGAAEGTENNTVDGTATVDDSSKENDVAEEASPEKSSADGEIVVVYTNDIHSYIDNVVKDSDGNVTGDGMRFSKIAAMVEDMRADGKNVILVDSGDEIQGTVYGAMDEGKTVIEIMNATGYELATPGNHDFDYGVIEFLRLVEDAQFQYVTCNFHSTESKEIVMPASKIFELGGKKVAFIGISTPVTITSSTPTYFQNEKGEFIYTVDGLANPADMYTSVQNAIDNVKDKADYIVAVGHVGVGIDEQNKGISSYDIIANVSGLNAFIDGHSHTTMEGETVKDKDGNKVLLTQTGSYFGAVGVMTISEVGEVSTKLVNEYDREDEKVAELEKNWIQDVYNQMGESIGTLETTLYVNNPDDDNQRLIRAMEMNSGDFTADSVYWFFNERLDLECDVVLQNSGGIRTQTEKGDLTYLTAKQICPFGNMVCLISATGQQIVDALEMGVNVIGIWDDEWNAPEENGGFMQVAGLTYTIDASVKSSVETDENGLFAGVNGEYRVKDVKVYNKASGEYEAIDLNKEYYVGGINYILRNDGNGLSMFENDDLTVDYVGQDYVILAEYIKSFSDDGTVNTINSPLHDYKGYLLDYENPYGAGRIVINGVDYNNK